MSDELITFYIDGTWSHLRASLQVLTKMNKFYFILILKSQYKNMNKNKLETKNTTKILICFFFTKILLFFFTCKFAIRQKTPDFCGEIQMQTEKFILKYKLEKKREREKKALFACCNFIKLRVKLNTARSCNWAAFLLLSNNCRLTCTLFGSMS